MRVLRKIIRDTMVSPLTVSSIWTKIASITVNPIPGTVPDAQEVYNNVLWN